MVELLLQRAGDQMRVQFGDYQDTVSLSESVLASNPWMHIYKDAVDYGKKLFDTIFPQEEMRSLLASLPRDERLLLVAEDPFLAAIPWEYLRDQEGKLLAARLPLVRGLPENKRRDELVLNRPLEIIAVPVSPVDNNLVLNVENEWNNLINAVKQTNPLQKLTLKRVRPPTRSQLEQAQNRQKQSIIHFMGHGASIDGKTFLAFEDAHARTHLVDAADFAASLEQGVCLVILNSCLSATVVPTEFGNIARVLVERGIPYVLGMQSTIPDDAALVLSERLYGFLLQGYGIEEAVTRVRRALEEPGKLAYPELLAGIPVLYTNLRIPASPFELPQGKPIIQPDPDHLQKNCNLAALPLAPHFLGRSQEIKQALGILLAPAAKGFVLLHGLGGIGKTSLARVLAERVSWYYNDRVLAYSFETFAHLDPHHHYAIDETFPERFYNQLAHFYGLDPTSYTATSELQKAILQQRIHKRSLLVLDNVETLFDIQWQRHSTAQRLIAFIHRLGEGNGTILLTSRQMLPKDWGDYIFISLSGLSEEGGAALFHASLSQQTKEFAASKKARQALSRKVQGHPLAIRLLAARFIEQSADGLEHFLEHLEADLDSAGQMTPSSLEDPERQRTLYACLAYSIKCLTPEQELVLRAVSLFQAPFTPDFVVQILADEQAAMHTQALFRLSLLEISNQSQTFPEGKLLLLELHSMVRWYIEECMPPPEPEWQERYGTLYISLLGWANEEYETDALLRSLVRLTLPDSERASYYLPPEQQGIFAYYLAHVYSWVGEHKHAEVFYEQALEAHRKSGDAKQVAIIQRTMAQVLTERNKLLEASTMLQQSLHTLEQLGDPYEIAKTQSILAQVLVLLDKFQEAFSLLQQSLLTFQQLGRVREVAITQGGMAELLFKQDKVPEALSLYEQALLAFQELNDVRNAATIRYHWADALVEQDKLKDAYDLYEQALIAYQELDMSYESATTQGVMADVLVKQKKIPEALSLYEQSLLTKQKLGDMFGVALTQRGIAYLLEQQGKSLEALSFYEQALAIYQELGDSREIAVTQHAMGHLLIAQKNQQESLYFYEQSLHMYQELGMTRGIAATQHIMANVLVQQDKQQEAFSLYEQALQIYQDLDEVQTVAQIQRALAKILFKQGKLPEAFSLYEQVLQTSQEVSDVRSVAITQHAMARILAQQGKFDEALSLYEQSLLIQQELGGVSEIAMTQHAMADALTKQGKLQKAFSFYEQALPTYQELADTRGIAMVQYAMAGILVQQGKFDEGFSLYEQALPTYQKIGDIRDIARTQHALADVLIDQGKPQEALSLCEQILPIYQELGDLLQIAVVQHTMGDALLQQDKLSEALSLYEQALHTKQELGDLLGVATTQHALADVLVRQNRLTEALSLYKQALDTKEKFGTVREIAITRHAIARTLDRQGVFSEALSFYEQALHTYQKLGDAHNASIAQRDIARIRKQQASHLASIQVSEEVIQAIGDFIGTEEWQAMQANVEARQEILFREEVEQLFELNIILAQADGNDHAARLLKQRLKLLRTCKEQGIERAFAQVLSSQQGTLSFDPELPGRSIAALLGGPQEKLVHTQYLITQANTTSDEQLQALIRTIQLALFSTDLSLLGQDLQGIYRQTWEVIALQVETGGVDPQIFEQLANNTLAVFSSAIENRSQWRRTLANILDQATARGDRKMAILLNALIALLDANGSPAGLGEGLQGIYAETWQTIVRHLPEN